jgi:hypothetical protein
MGIISKLANLITKIDMFGQGIKLRIHKRVESKTLFGGILSNIMIILLLLMFLFEANDVVYKQNPQISLEQQVLLKAPNLTLDSFTFPIAASLTANTNVGLYLPKYFNYSAYLIYGETSDELKTKYFNLISCKKEFFPNILQEQYDNLLLDNGFCIENQNQTIVGSWSDSFISYLSFKISLCVNSTVNNNDCAPIEEIMSFLNTTSYFWNLYYQNTNINCEDAENPVTYNIVNFYRIISTTSYKFTELYLRQQMLDSDEGFIFKSKNKSPSVSFDYYKFDDTSIDDSQTLVEFNILVSNNYYIYHRSYTKIQAVLASVGGMANLLKIIFVIFSYIFSIVKRDEIILNQIFDFDYSEEFLEEIKSKKRMNEKKIVMSSNFYNPQMGIKEPGENKNNFSLNEHTLVVNNDKNNFKNKISKISDNIKIKEKTSFLFYNSLRFSQNQTSSPPIIHQGKPFSIRNHRFPDNPNDSKLKFNCLNNVNLSTTTKFVNNPIGDPIEALLKNDTKTFKKTYKSTNANEIIRNIESKNKNHELKFTFYEVFLAFCCFDYCNKAKLISKKKLYTKSKFAIDNYMDITYIIQKLEEFEKFKIVMLTTQQYALFNFISKEMISLDENKLNKHEMTQFKRLEKDQEYLVNIILECREKNFTLFLKFFESIFTL